MRPSKRLVDQMRNLSIEKNFTKHAEGSVLISFGDTKVLCNASVIEGVPRFLREKHQGWLTAEYGMLPRSTHSRIDREAVKGKQSGRTQEIQRLIGRALRAAIDLSKLPDYTIKIDCDVLQADGGTRTAAISGASLALEAAIAGMRKKALIEADVNPIISPVAAVSVGMFQGTPVLDLDYAEDSDAETDMNVVMTRDGGIIEIQGTAEKTPFSEAAFLHMLTLAKKGIGEIFQKTR